MSIATQSRPASYVEVPLTYTVKTGEKAVLYEWQRESSTHHFEQHPMKIQDARPLLDSLSLDTNGFTLVRHNTAVRDFYDPAEVHTVYFPEIERLMMDLTGAFRVIVFGEAVRTEGPQARSDRLPARNAHVDFNAPTVRGFVHGLAPTEAEELLKHRFALVNLWRPVKPIEKVPLAVCDARTVAADDLILGEIGVKPGDGAPRMEGFNVAFNPAHRWYYFPEMQTDELLVFKLCDSDASRMQWTAHTAFDDPTSAPDAPARESIEVRTISFFRD